MVKFLAVGVVVLTLLVSAPVEAHTSGLLGLVLWCWLEKRSCESDVEDSYELCRRHREEAQCQALYERQMSVCQRIYDDCLPW